MNKREAYELGRECAAEADEYGDYTTEELANADTFGQAMYEVLENARQYAGHPTYDIAGKRNADSLYEAFEQGESDGIAEAIERRGLE